MGKPGVLQSMGSKESDTTERLNNNKRKQGEAGKHEIKGSSSLPSV